MALIALGITQRANRSQLLARLGGTHDVRGLDTIGGAAPDVILADRPGLDTWAGKIETARTAASPAALPVLLLARQGEQGRVLEQLGETIDDVVCVPVSPPELRARLNALLRVRRLTQAQAEEGNRLASYNELLQDQVEQATGRLRQAFAETVATLTTAAEFKDTDTGDHVKRVAHFTVRLADEIGCDRDFRHNLFYAAPMHDVGKIGIPDSVLLKPGRLTSEEWATMKTHTTIGHQILDGTRAPYTRLGAEIALYHHERYTGGGYPTGRKGDAVPLSAYLMALVDVYDALRSLRPYKPAMPHDKVCAIIREGDGRTLPDQFHPDALAAFERCADDFADIYDAYADAAFDS